MADTDMVTQAFKRADELKAEKEKLYERLDANRKFLRLLRDNGTMTDDQAKRVEELYPTPKPRAKKAPAPGESTGEQAPPREPEPTADESPAQGSPAAKSPPRSGGRRN